MWDTSPVLSASATSHPITQWHPVWLLFVFHYPGKTTTSYIDYFLLVPHSQHSPYRQPKTNYHDNKYFGGNPKHHHQEISCKNETDEKRMFTKSSSSWKCGVKATKYLFTMMTASKQKTWLWCNQLTLRLLRFSFDHEVVLKVSWCVSFLFLCNLCFGSTSVVLCYWKANVLNLFSWRNTPRYHKGASLNLPVIPRTNKDIHSIGIIDLEVVAASRRLSQKGMIQTKTFMNA